MIGLIDDQLYGLDQVYSAIPRGLPAEVLYFDMSKTFLSHPGIFDVALLDYHLAKEGIKSTDILRQIRRKARTVIGFSSRVEGNSNLLINGADEAVQKLRHHHNPALQQLFLEIFSSESVR